MRANASAFARHARLVTPLLLALATAAAQAEPPEWPGLQCRVLQQRVADGMSLEVQFTNSTDQALSLPAGPHLVWYRDTAAEDAMERTVRASRVQNVPLQLPAGTTRSALFAFTPQLLDELRCNVAPPAAAALYFYQFNPRPRFRCLLQGYELGAVTVGVGGACSSTLRP